MALIKCAECRKKVSTKAQTCPNCGAPVELAKSKSTSKWLWIIGILSAGCILIGLPHVFPKAVAAASLAVIVLCIVFLFSSEFRTGIFNLFKIDTKHKTHIMICVYILAACSMLPAALSIRTLIKEASEEKRLAKEAEAKRQAEEQAEYLKQKAIKKYSQLLHYSRKHIASGELEYAKGTLNSAISLPHVPDTNEARKLLKDLEETTNADILREKLVSLSAEDFQYVLAGNSIPERLLPSDPCLHDLYTKGLKDNLKAAVTARKQIADAKRRASTH